MASTRNCPRPATPGSRQCSQDAVNSPCFSTSSLDTATSPSHPSSFSRLPSAPACADAAVVATCALHPQPLAQAIANARATAVLEEQRRREEEQLAAQVAAEATRSPPQQVLQRIKECLHAPHPSADSLCRSAADLGHLLFSAAAVNTRGGGFALVAPILARAHASRAQRHASNVVGCDAMTVNGSMSGERLSLSVLTSSASSVEGATQQEVGAVRVGWEEEEPVADTTFFPATAIYGGSIVGQCVALLTEILTFTTHPGVRAAAFTQLWRNRELLCYLTLPSQSVAAGGVRRNLLALLTQQNLDNRTRAMAMVLISSGGAPIIGQDAAVLEATLQSLACLWGDALTSLEEEQCAETAFHVRSASPRSISSLLSPSVSSTIFPEASPPSWGREAPRADRLRSLLGSHAPRVCPDSGFQETMERVRLLSDLPSPCHFDGEDVPSLAAAASAAGLAAVACSAIAALLPFASGDAGIRVLKRLFAYSWLSVLEPVEGAREQSEGEEEQSVGGDPPLEDHSRGRVPELPLVQRDDEDWDASGDNESGDCALCRRQARSLQHFPHCMQRASSVATLLASTSSLQPEVAAWALRMLWAVVDSLNERCSSFDVTALTAVEAKKWLGSLQPLRLFEDLGPPNCAHSSLTASRNSNEGEDDESSRQRHLPGGSGELPHVESGVSEGSLSSLLGHAQPCRCVRCGAVTLYYLRRRLLHQALATMTTCVEATQQLTLNHADALGPLQMAALKQVLGSCGCSRMWHTGATAPGVGDVQEEGSIVAAALRSLLDFLLLGLLDRAPPFRSFVFCQRENVACFDPRAPPASVEAGQRPKEKPFSVLLGDPVDAGLLSAVMSSTPRRACPTCPGVSPTAGAAPSSTLKRKTLFGKRPPPPSSCCSTSVRLPVIRRVRKHESSGPRTFHGDDLFFRREAVQFREILSPWLRAAALEGAAAVCALLAVLSAVTGWSLPDSRQSERLTNPKKRGGIRAAGNPVMGSGAYAARRGSDLARAVYVEQAADGHQSDLSPGLCCLVHECDDEVIIQKEELESTDVQELARRGLSRVQSGSPLCKYALCTGAPRFAEPAKGEQQEHGYARRRRGTSEEERVRHEGNSGRIKKGNLRKTATGLHAGPPGMVASSLRLSPRAFAPSSPVACSRVEGKLCASSSSAPSRSESTLPSPPTGSMASPPATLSWSAHNPLSAPGLALAAVAQQTILRTRCVSGPLLLSGLRQLAAVQEGGSCTAALAFPIQSCSTLPVGSCSTASGVTGVAGAVLDGREGGDQGNHQPDAKDPSCPAVSTTRVDSRVGGTDGTAFKQSRKSSKPLPSTPSSSEEDGEEKEEGELSDDGAPSSARLSEGSRTQEYGKRFSACVESPQAVPAAVAGRKSLASAPRDQNRETGACTHPLNGLARETRTVSSQSERVSSPSLAHSARSAEFVAAGFSSPDRGLEESTDSSSTGDDTEEICHFEVLRLQSFRKRCRACGVRPAVVRRGSTQASPRWGAGTDCGRLKRRGRKKEERLHEGHVDDTRPCFATLAVVSRSASTSSFSEIRHLPCGFLQTNHHRSRTDGETSAEDHFRMREQLKTTLDLLLQLSKNESKSPHRLRVLSLLVALQTVSWLSLPVPWAVAVVLASKKSVPASPTPLGWPAPEQSLLEGGCSQAGRQCFAQAKNKDGEGPGRRAKRDELTSENGSRDPRTCQKAVSLVQAALHEEDLAVKQLVTAVAEALADFLLNEEDRDPATLQTGGVRGVSFRTWKELRRSTGALEEERTQVVAPWLARCLLSVHSHSPRTAKIMAEAFLRRLISSARVSFSSSDCTASHMSSAGVFALPMLSLFSLCSLSRLLCLFYPSASREALSSSSCAPVLPPSLEGRSRPASLASSSRLRKTPSMSCQGARMPSALFGTLSSPSALKFVFQQSLQGPYAGVPLACLLKRLRVEDGKQMRGWSSAKTACQAGLQGQALPLSSTPEDAHAGKPLFSCDAASVLDVWSAHFEWLKVYRNGIELFLADLSSAYHLQRPRGVGLGPALVSSDLTLSLLLPTSSSRCGGRLRAAASPPHTSSAPAFPPSLSGESATGTDSASFGRGRAKEVSSVHRVPLFHFDFPLCYGTLYKAAVGAGVAGFPQSASAFFEACSSVTATSESSSWLRALSAALRAEAALSLRESVFQRRALPTPAKKGSSSGHDTAAFFIPTATAEEGRLSSFASYGAERGQGEAFSELLGEAVRRARLAVSEAEGLWRAALDHLELFRRHQRRILGAGQSSTGGRPQPLLEAFARGRLATTSALLSLIAFCKRCYHGPRLVRYPQKTPSREANELGQAQLLASSAGDSQTSQTSMFPSSPTGVVSPRSAVSSSSPPLDSGGSDRSLGPSWRSSEARGRGEDAPEARVARSPGERRVLCLEDDAEIKQEGAVFEEILADLERLRLHFSGLHTQLSHFATQPLPFCPTSRRLLGLQDCLCRTGVLLTTFLLTRLLRTHALLLCFSRGFRYIPRHPLLKCTCAASFGEGPVLLPHSQASEQIPAPDIECGRTGREQDGESTGRSSELTRKHPRKGTGDSPKKGQFPNSAGASASKSTEVFVEGSSSLPEPAALDSRTDMKHLFSPVLGLISLSSDRFLNPPENLAQFKEGANAAVEAMSSARHIGSALLPFSSSCCSLAHRPESLNLLPLWLNASASSPARALCWVPDDTQTPEPRTARGAFPCVKSTLKASLSFSASSGEPARRSPPTREVTARHDAAQLGVSDETLFPFCSPSEGAEQPSQSGCASNDFATLAFSRSSSLVSASATTEARRINQAEVAKSSSSKDCKPSGRSALIELYPRRVRPFYFMNTLASKLVLVSPPLVVCWSSISPAASLSPDGPHVSGVPRAETGSSPAASVERVASPGLLEGIASDSEDSGDALKATRESPRSSGASTSVSGAYEVSCRANSGVGRGDVVSSREEDIPRTTDQTAANGFNESEVIDVDDEAATAVLGRKSAERRCSTQSDCAVLCVGSSAGAEPSQDDTAEKGPDSEARKKDSASPPLSFTDAFSVTDEVDACSLWGNLVEKGATAASLLLRTAFPPHLLRQVVELSELCTYTPFPLPPRIFNPRPLPWVAVRAVLSGEEEDSRGRCVCPTISFTGELRDAGVQIVAAWAFVRLRLSVGSGQGSFQQATLHSSLQAKDNGQDVITVDDVPVAQPIPQAGALWRSKDRSCEQTMETNASPLRYAGGLRTFSHTSVLNVPMAVLPCLLVEALPLDSRRRVIGERSSTFVAVSAAQKNLDL